ncbi:hypothetical protein [Singulisphaera acidiphila]|uniref:Uncharacterized protein n=1 Tax=Singulisphaera acidiphila (strain ATCC BAA-1392 / DSM 18658 / VKM B-2454 / MOB10) TaxID=886293 RepID=L0DEU4_SINAD|nr:hypothetical protein [Singulisphaera acidiphila]AGA27874.1 hypothetical protein Sinac_3625 [Singulisphaera acidiphila DSM 18658]
MRPSAAMKLDPNPQHAWKTNGLAVGFLLATCFVLTPGCGSEAPKPPAAFTIPVSSDPPQVKAKAKGKGEAFDDLRERRAKKRLAAQS